MLTHSAPLIGDSSSKTAEIYLRAGLISKYIVDKPTVLTNLNTHKENEVKMLKGRSRKKTVESKGKYT